MLGWTASGSTANTEAWLKRMMNGDMYSRVEALAKQGVSALSSATPLESGQTAGSWGYVIKRSGKSLTIEWTNSHMVNGVPIAIILQYGHGTGTGGYVQGRNYINPAIKPVMDQLAEAVWREVAK